MLHRRLLAVACLVACASGRDQCQRNPFLDTDCMKSAYEGSRDGDGDVKVGYGVGNVFQHHCKSTNCAVDGCTDALCASVGCPCPSPAGNTDFSNPSALQYSGNAAADKTTCAPNATGSGSPTCSVWATSNTEFRDDSSICRAAIQQGVLKPTEAGFVEVVVAPNNNPAFTSKTANGITSFQAANDDWKRNVIIYPPCRLCPGLADSDLTGTDRAHCKSADPATNNNCGHSGQATGGESSSYTVPRSGVNYYSVKMPNPSTATADYFMDISLTADSGDPDLFMSCYNCDNPLDPLYEVDGTAQSKGGPHGGRFPKRGIFHTIWHSQQVGDDSLHISRKDFQDKCGYTAASTVAAPVKAAKNICLGIGVYGYQCANYRINAVSDETITHLVRNQQLDVNLPNAGHVVYFYIDGSRSELEDVRLTITRQEGEGEVTLRGINCNDNHNEFPATAGDWTTSNCQDPAATSTTADFTMSLTNGATTSTKVLDHTSEGFGANCVGTDSCRYYLAVETAAGSSFNRLTLAAHVENEVASLPANEPVHSAVGAGETVYFKFTVDRGYSCDGQTAPADGGQCYPSVQILATATSGDPDIYVKSSKESDVDIKPSASNRDFYSFEVGSDSVTIQPVASRHYCPGVESEDSASLYSTCTNRVTFYIAVRAYQATDFSILAQAYDATGSSIVPLSNGQQQDGAVSSGMYQYYKMQVVGDVRPNHPRSLTIQLTRKQRMFNNLDLYVKESTASTIDSTDASNLLPNTTWYDAKATAYGDDRLTILYEEDKTYYIGVYCETGNFGAAAAEFTIVASTACNDAAATGCDAIIRLKDAQPLAGHVNKKNYRYYSAVLPKIQENMEITVTTLQGDADIFVSKTNRYPNMTDYDQKAMTYGDDTIRITRQETALDELYYISVYGFYATDYTLMVSVANSIVQLSPGEPQNAVVKYQGYKYFSTVVESSATDLTIAVDCVFASVCHLKLFVSFCSQSNVNRCDRPNATHYTFTSAGDYASSNLLKIDHDSVGFNANAHILISVGDSCSAGQGCWLWNNFQITASNKQQMVRLAEGVPQREIVTQGSFEYFSFRINDPEIRSLTISVEPLETGGDIDLYINRCFQGPDGAALVPDQCPAGGSHPNTTNYWVMENDWGDDSVVVPPNGEQISCTEGADHMLSGCFVYIAVYGYGHAMPFRLLVEATRDNDLAPARTVGLGETVRGAVPHNGYTYYALALPSLHSAVEVTLAGGWYAPGMYISLCSSDTGRDLCPRPTKEVNDLAGPGKYYSANSLSLKVSDFPGRCQAPDQGDPSTTFHSPCIWLIGIYGENGGADFTVTFSSPDIATQVMPGTPLPVYLQAGATARYSVGPLPQAKADAGALDIAMQFSSDSASAASLSLIGSINAKPTAENGEVLKSGAQHLYISKDEVCPASLKGKCASKYFVTITAGPAFVSFNLTVTTSSVTALLDDEVMLTQTLTAGIVMHYETRPIRKTTQSLTVLSTCTKQPLTLYHSQNTAQPETVPDNAIAMQSGRSLRLTTINGEQHSPKHAFFAVKYEDTAASAADQSTFQIVNHLDPDVDRPHDDLTTGGCSPKLFPGSGRLDWNPTTGGSTAAAVNLLAAAASKTSQATVSFYQAHPASAKCVPNTTSAVASAKFRYRVYYRELFTGEAESATATPMNSPCYLKTLNFTDVFVVNTSYHTVTIPGLDPNARYEVNVVVGMGEDMTYQVPYSATFMMGSGPPVKAADGWGYFWAVIAVLVVCVCCMAVCLAGLKYYNKTHGFMFRSLLSSDGNNSGGRDTSYLDSREMAPTAVDNDDPEDAPMSLRVGGGDDEDETSEYGNM